MENEMDRHYRKSDLDIAEIKADLKSMGQGIEEIKKSVRDLVEYGGKNRELISKNCSDILVVKSNTSTQWYFIAFIVVALIGAAVKILLAGSL